MIARKMSRINYIMHRFLRIPLYTCSGCTMHDCPHRVNQFQYPCISWRRFAK